MTRPTFILALLLAAAACQAPAPQRPTAATPASGGGMAMSTSARIPADSFYAAASARLTSAGHRIDEAYAAERRLVVRPPGSEQRVEVRIAAAGDSSIMSVMALGGGGLTAGLQGVLAVMSDATSEPESASARACGESRNPPDSRWRPELYVTGEGRLWLATGGLYTADSLGGPWRCVLGRGNGVVDADDLRIGTPMAFVGRDTILFGLDSPTSGEKGGSRLFRTTDAGRTWSPVPTPGLVSIDAMEASGPSVWAFATRWEEKQRRGVWMRSEDGGATWTQPALPRGMNDVTHVYRESPTTAYVATAGFNAGGVFWRTTDGGTTWTRVPTPKDQGVHEIPSHGTRIEHIATVGDRLVVREYGMVFVTRADSIRWRRLDDVEYVTADRKRGELFVLTDKLEAAMLDRELRMVWRTSDRIPSSRSRDVEEVVAHAGTGWVTMSQGEIYEARDGRLRVVRPGGDRAR